MWLSEALIKQAGAELGQAQVKLEILDKVGVKVEVEIVADDGVQLLAWVVGGWWVKLKLKLELSLAIVFATLGKVSKTSRWGGSLIFMGGTKIFSLRSKTFPSWPL